MWPFKKKPKQYLLDQKYKVVEAFTNDGLKYFQFDDANNLPSGRGLCALTIYEEFNMRCTREYLELHVRAVEKLLSDPKKINILALATIHNNLKKRGGR